MQQETLRSSEEQRPSFGRGAALLRYLCICTVKKRTFLCIWRPSEALSLVQSLFKSCINLRFKLICVLSLMAKFTSKWAVNKGMNVFEITSAITPGALFNTPSGAQCFKCPCGLWWVGEAISGKEWTYMSMQLENQVLSDILKRKLKIFFIRCSVKFYQFAGAVGGRGQVWWLSEILSDLDDTKQ